MKTNATLQPREHPTLLHPNSTDLHQTHPPLQPMTVSPFLPTQFEEQQKTVFFSDEDGNFSIPFTGSHPPVAALLVQ